jgi:hypothetical protein
MGTVVRLIASESQPTPTFSLTTRTLTNIRIIKAEIRQPKSEKGTRHHPFPVPFSSISHRNASRFFIPLTDI